MKNKDLNFEYIEEFVDHIIDEVYYNDDLFLSIVCKFDEVKRIIKILAAAVDIDFEAINLESPEMSGYSDEYVLSCWCEEGIVQIGCEPAKRDGEYFTLADDEEVAYIFDNCSSQVLKHCGEADLYFVNIDEDSDYEGECEDCTCESCKNDGLCSAGSTSSYSINGKSVSKKEFDKKYSEIQSNYEKNMKRMLDDYHSFMDDIDNMFNRLW